MKQAILSENELVTKLDSGMMGPGQKVAYIEEEILPVERDLLEELNQVEPADPQLKSAHEEALLMAEKGVAAFEAYASYYAGNIDAKPRAAELRSDQVRHRSAWIRTVLALEERVDLQ